MKKALSIVQTNLSHIQLFHTDCGNEFKNRIIDEILELFEIERSFIVKGCPYDNAVAETTYKVIKTEFVKNQRFETHKQLGYEFVDYVNGDSGNEKHHPQLLGNGYNNNRIHFFAGIFISS